MENEVILKRVYFKNLDLIRFLAAYMIVIFHAFYGWKENFGFPDFMQDGEGKLNWLGTYLERGMHNLSFGVDMFFLISGFLITHLLLREREETSDISIQKFYIRRAFRIWPLFYFTLALGPILTWIYNEPDANYLNHALFLGNFDLIKNGFGSVAVNHLWSICVEEHFYLVAPLIVAFVPMRKIVPVFMVIVLFSIFFRASVFGTEGYWMNLYMNTFSRIDVLAIGSICGYLYFTGKLKFNDGPEIRFPIYAVFLFLFFTDILVYWDNLFLATMKKYVYVLMAGYWIGNFLFNPGAFGSPAKLNYFHHLGKMSYGMYMLNPIIVAIVIKSFHKYNWEGMFFYMFLIHAGVFIAINLSYYLIELPFLKAKERFAVVKSGGELKRLLDEPMFGPFAKKV